MKNNFRKFLFVRNNILWLSVLNMVDFFFTFLIVFFLGGVELNPFFSVLNNGEGFWFFFLCKFGISVMLLFIAFRLFVLWERMHKWVVFSWFVLSLFALFSYLLLVVNNLFVLVMSIITL